MMSRMTSDSLFVYNVASIETYLNTAGLDCGHCYANQTLNMLHNSVHDHFLEATTVASRTSHPERPSHAAFYALHYVQFMPCPQQTSRSSSRLPSDQYCWLICRRSIPETPRSNNLYQCPSSVALLVVLKHPHQLLRRLIARHACHVVLERHCLLFAFGCPNGPNA